MPTQDALFNLLCAIPAILAGLTVHEFAHAWVADRLGDDTPRREGRVTLDPIVHIDPMGALFFLISSLAGFGLGWAKPVMTNPRNFQHPRRDSLLVAIAGPISNVLQTPFWLLAVVIYGFVAAKTGADPMAISSVGGLIFQALFLGVIVNISLAVFNMIPIPPLDGHWVLQSIGGRPVEELFDAIRPFAFPLLFIIISFTPLVSNILRPFRVMATDWAGHALMAGMRLGGIGG